MMLTTKILLAVVIPCVVKFDVVISLTDHWPSGSYTMPKPKSGCPHTDKTTWKEAWRFQDLENDAKQGSKFSSNFHMDAKIVNNDLERGFCTNNNQGVQEPWPVGSYCLYRNANHCPPNMTQGFIEWYDEQEKNQNRFNNYLSLPDGIYFGPSTRLLYCCHTTGKWYKSIQLPTENPFYLLPYGSGNCQRVVGTISSLEYIVYDTEDENNWDEFDGHHVFTDKVESWPKVFYCYYEGCQYQLRNKRGSFSSPNLHNGSYPDFQHCSWSINVNVPARILLKFQTLQVPNCKENSLDIFDGDSSEGSTLLARFCGKNATSGANVISTTSNLYIVFKSGKRFDKDTKDWSKRLQFHAEYSSLEAATPIFPTKISTKKKTQPQESSTLKVPWNIINFGKETSPTATFTTTRKRTTTDVRKHSTDNIYGNEETNSQIANNEYSSIYFLTALPILGMMILLVVIGTLFYWIRNKKMDVVEINGKIEKTAV